jgi:small subunit ribosomal protein S1
MKKLSILNSNIMSKLDFSGLKFLKEGDLVEGKVIGIGRSSVYLDLGPLGTGIIYGREFLKVKNILKNVKIGDKITAKVVELENEDGYRELSLEQAREKEVWEKIKELKEKDEIVKVKIKGANKGGLLTEFEGIPAFIPVSQLAPEHYPRIEGADKQKILQELQKFVGKTMEVKVLDFDPRESKLIFSERAKELERIKRLIQKYRLGDIVEGEVTGTAEFGIFIKFDEDGLEGFAHISELDWFLIDDPRNYFKPGDKVKAKIVRIDEDRVFLSLKALKKNPYKELEKKIKVGDILVGTVIKFTPNGALVKLKSNLQGLVPLSQFQSTEEMIDKLELDKKYKFEVITVDKDKCKILLKPQKS